MAKIAKYQPGKIEPRWQRYWDQHQTFRTLKDPERPKFYCLVMFPYPSGRIHMGHLRNYAIGDVIARYKKLRGFNILHPMGWDAFGLPAENAAMDKGIPPAKWTTENIRTMSRQLRAMGLSYDWDREIATCSEEYYRWNQWLFLRMHEKGLAYKKMSAVNWCPSCRTVLANEQVVDGQCWRCESPITQKELSQWFLRITDYAEELLKDCARLTGWPERVIAMQTHWIGRSEGVEVDFPLTGESDKTLRIFTTRPDTLCGATFMVMAPEHPLVESLVQGKPGAKEAMAAIQRMTGQDRKVRTAQDLEKEGVFTGAHAINPLTREEIPIWVANFVLMEYGTGIIMSVPAHDQRDFEFAKKYHLPIRLVIQNPEHSLDPQHLAQAYTEETGNLVESGPFSGLSVKESQEKIAQHIEKNGLGKRAVHYKLRDWGISRQRYWGTPIPIIYCEECGIVPVPEKDLPVRLPPDISPETRAGKSPLQECTTFYEASCPKCRRPARRETDTMDTFVDSSWYFLRYTDPHASDAPINPQEVSDWMPVDQYIGGIEHAVLHLLYARFFTKVIRDLGLMGPNPVNEPFTRLLTQGMVVKETHTCPRHGYLFPEEVTETQNCALCPQDRESSRVKVGRTEKMSKSKKNVVDPETLLERYGADTARLFILFAAPPEKDLEWNDAGVEGATRFLHRAWRLIHQYADTLHEISPLPEDLKTLPDPLRKIRTAVHRTIRKVTQDIEKQYHFNTAISALMELVNTLYLARETAGPEIKSGGAQKAAKALWKETLETLVVLLSPFVPHLSEELWKQLGHDQSVFCAPWPDWDEAAIQSDTLSIVVQVNGRVRAQLQIPADLDEETIRQRALVHASIQPWISGKEIRKLIQVPGRLINIVV